MSDELVGENLGKYEVKERIGRGGMAEVYKAYHESLDRFVAVKVLHPFLGEDPEFQERFEREARNIARLKHTNIVQVYDFDVDNKRDLYYMIMEFIDGPTLRTRLMQLSFQGEQFSITEAVRVIRDLASALAYAHSRGMIHRDIKPANIMLDSDGRVVLTDFGIARIVSGPTMTASGSMVGTPAYMSPEQGLGQPGDNRSDIYSLGVVLYQLVTGTTPYDADTPIAIVLKHVNDPLPPPTTINSTIPEALERIIFRALAKSPDERYQNIEEMVEHLDNLDASDTKILPASPVQAAMAAKAKAAPSAQPRPARQKSRARFPRTLFAMLVAIVSLLAGGYLSFTGQLDSALAQVPIVQLPEEPTATSEEPAVAATGPTSTPTPNLQATELALTVEALSASITESEEPNIPPTPDLTATIIACDFDYEIVTQDPENESVYPELTTLSLTLTIVNDSQCAIDDDTRMVFLEGEQLEGPDFIEFNQRLEPGDEFTIELDLRTPEYIETDPDIESTWIFVQPDGTQVGQPLIIEFTLFTEVG